MRATIDWSARTPAEYFFWPMSSAAAAMLIDQRRLLACPGQAIGGGRTAGAVAR